MRGSWCQSGRSSRCSSSRRHRPRPVAARAPRSPRASLASSSSPRARPPPSSQARKPGHRRQCREGLEPRQFGRQRIDHPLDQEIAEADPDQPTLAVRDRIEDRGVGGLRVADRRRLVEQRVDIAGDPGDQRHLDKDQRLVGHARMKEGEAAAIRLEPVFQIGPAADLVHRLVGHQLFEQRGRRFPGNPAQFEKADIEPVGEQVAQIVGEAAQRRVAAGRCSISSARRSTRNLTPSGKRVELAQQGDARRRQRGAQRPFGGAALAAGRRPRQRARSSCSTASWSVSNSSASSRRKRSRPAAFSAR